MEAPDDWPTGRLLSTAARLVEQAWAERLDALGLTHAGLVALHLVQAGPRSQTDLARAARVQVQTIARTLERLERYGLVTRTRDAADARRVLVTTTAAGAATFERVLVTTTAAGAATFERARSLESEVFPAVADPDGLRAALLRIVTSASGRP